MPHDRPSEEGVPASARQFATTHWSVVLTAGQGHSPNSAEALAALCQTYWYPLYAFARRLGHGRPDAQDLTQQFFARLLEKDYLRAASPERGRFRSFLLTAFKRFLANEWDRAQTLKRGGDQVLISLDFETAESRFASEPIHESSPDRLFEQRWALDLLEKVLERLRGEYQAHGRAEVFARLEGNLSSEKTAAPYGEIAVALRTTEAAVKMQVLRMRRRFGELLREEVGQLVASTEEIDAEIRHLFSALKI